MTEQIFGVIVAGRAIQTNFIQAGEREFVVELPNSEAINHIVVFLTGVQVFPDGFGGSVYVRWPGEAGDVNWHYLGHVSNFKPSAIFKIAQLVNQKSDNSDLLFLNSYAVAHGNAMIGIMVEPLTEIELKTPASGTAASTQSTIMQFAQKMTNNLVEFLSSHVISLPDPNNPGHIAEFIPAKAVQTWQETFQRRFNLNPNFWRFLP